MRKEQVLSNLTKAILQDLRSRLEVIYSKRLKGVYLYGSYARGEEDSESDLDILIVLDRVDHYGAEIDRTGYMVSELSLKYGVSISRVFVSQRDWRHQETPFLANVREEAIRA